MNAEATREGDAPRPRPGRRLILVAVALAVAGLLWYGWAWYQQRANRLRGLELARSTAQFEQAEPLLLAALRSRPDDVEVVKALAQNYGELNHTRTGELLDRWVALRPSDPTPLLQRMEYHARQQDYPPALADAERLLQLDPNEPTARRHLAAYAFAAGQFPRAERACRDGLRRAPSDRSTRRLLANALRAQGNIDETVEILEGLLREDENDSAALVALGHLFYETGQARRAIPLLRKALDDPKRWGTSRYYLALALKQDGQEEEANKLLAQVNKLREVDLLVAESGHYPTHVGLKVKAGRACADLGQDERAIELLTSAVEMDPACAEAHRLLARLHEKHGRSELAERHRQLAQSVTGPESPP
jgi:tetratricopeptide (TPR) repeat protein